MEWVLDLVHSVVDLMAAPLDHCHHGGRLKEFRTFNDPFSDFSGVLIRFSVPLSGFSGGCSGFVMDFNWTHCWV